MLFAGISLLHIPASAQYNEVGILVGGSTYKGELAPNLFKSDFNHLAGGVFFSTQLESPLELEG